MKHVYWTILMLLVLWYQPTHGQDKKAATRTITGQALSEDTKESVPFATITVVGDSAKILNRFAADGNGKFNIQMKKADKYRLVITAVGFGKADVSVAFDESETKKEIGKVHLKEGVELKEVTIAAQKPLIKSEPDKLVYSVESDPEGQTTTAQEIFRKVPMLAVDNDENVTLNGQTNYKVLINGKASTMMEKNFKEVIKSMPANTIKDIEVITNPSSKYEAEGVGGVINIITTKAKNDSYNGSVGASADTYGGVGGNAYIAAQMGKVTLSANVYSNYYTQPESEGWSKRENFLLDDMNKTQSNTKSKYSGLGNSFSFDFGYEIDSLNLISASGWGYVGGNNNTMNSTTQDYTRSGDLFRHYTNLSSGKSNYGFGSANIDYQRSFKKPQKSFTVSYKYDFNPQDSWFENNIDGIKNYTSYRQRSDNKAGSNNHTIQIDYFDPISQMHQIEAGLKYILRMNNSNTDVSFFDSTAMHWEIDPTKRNDLNYDQHILGAYAGYLFKLKKFSTKAGLRAEQTWNDGAFISTQETKFINNYLNIIPYITLSYQLKPSQTVKVSYTQRLSRPGIWYLNPYVNDRDPMNISYGNPDLTSEVSHSFEGSWGMFTPKFNLNTAFNASLLDNAIERYTFVDPKGVSHSTYGNIGNRQNYNLNLYGSYRPTKNLTLGGNGRIGYTVIDSKGELNQRNEGVTYQFSLNGRQTLWKDAAVSLYGGVYSPWIMLQGSGSMFYYTSISVTQQLLKKNLDITVGINDPFERQKVYHQTMESYTYKSESHNYQYGQRAFLRVMYRFGKANTRVKKANRGINNDDVKSGGGGGEGGGGGGN